MTAKILKIHSLVKGTADNDVIVSIAGTLDDEPVLIHLPIIEWEKLVRNADWFRGKKPE